MSGIPGWAKALAVVGIILLLAIVVGVMWMNAHNREVSLRKTMKAKQVDNKNEYDGTWKKIAQAAQVSEKQKEGFREIFEGHAKARGGMKEGAVMQWLQESVPNVDLKTYQNLQNIIVGARDRFVMRQKELLDLKREHDTLLSSFPSMLFVGGRGEIDVTIVTSTKTEKTFAEGVEDDIDVFPSKEKAK